MKPPQPGADAIARLFLTQHIHVFLEEPLVLVKVAHAPRALSVDEARCPPQRQRPDLQPLDSRDRPRGQRSGIRCTGVGLPLKGGIPGASRRKEGAAKTTTGVRIDFPHARRISPWTGAGTGAGAGAPPGSEATLSC